MLCASLALVCALSALRGELLWIGDYWIYMRRGDLRIGWSVAPRGAWGFRLVPYDPTTVVSVSGRMVDTEYASIEWFHVDIYDPQDPSLLQRLPAWIRSRVAYRSGEYLVVWIPYWALLTAAALPTTVLWWRDRRFARGHCDICGYDLTGNTSGRCPECGGEIAREQESAGLRG